MDRKPGPVRPPCPSQGAVSNTRGVAGHLGARGRVSISGGAARKQISAPAEAGFSNKRAS